MLFYDIYLKFHHITGLHLNDNILVLYPLSSFSLPSLLIYDFFCTPGGHPGEVHSRLVASSELLSNVQGR